MEISQLLKEPFKKEFKQIKESGVQQT